MSAPITLRKQAGRWAVFKGKHVVTWANSTEVALWRRLRMAERLKAEWRKLAERRKARLPDVY